MNSNQFRKATAVLFPNVVFHFTDSAFSFTALGQGANEGINLFAKKDGEHITVQQMGESKAVHDVYAVLGSMSYPPDPFTAEQRQLELLRGVINSLKGATMPAVSEDATWYMKGYAAGVEAQHNMILTMLESALNAN